MAIVKRGDRGLKPGVIYALSRILFMVLEFNEKEKFAYRYINMRDKNELATPKRLKRQNLSVWRRRAIESFLARIWRLMRSFAAGKTVKSRATCFDIVVCQASRYFRRVNLPDKFAVKFGRALDVFASNDKI